MPLYKKKAVSDPCNYRAINLTSQMSKAVERILLPSFGPTLETTAFSDEQYAYRKKHGARDAVLLYVLSWIYELNIGNKVGVYCSDVSGVFDKVDAARLMEKLGSMNLNVQLLAVIRSWLRDRQGFVVVAGPKSDPCGCETWFFKEQFGAQCCGILSSATASSRFGLAASRWSFMRTIATHSVPSTGQFVTNTSWQNCASANVLCTVGAELTAPNSMRARRTLWVAPSSCYG